MNHVNKKNIKKDIECENQKIRSKIENAKSHYTINDINKRNQVLNDHKNILFQQSPSIAKLDPLIRKIETSTIASSKKVSYMLIKLHAAILTQFTFVDSLLLRDKLVEACDTLPAGVRYRALGEIALTAS